MPFCAGSCPSAVSTVIPASGFFACPDAAVLCAASISAAVCNVTIAMFQSLPLIRRGSNATQKTHRYRCSHLARPLVSDRNRCRLGDAVLLLPVTDRRADRIFCKHRAVNLHRRKRKLLDDVSVRDRKRLVDRLALHPLGRERRGSNRRTATEGLELGIFDHVRLGIHANLQTHHVATLWRADKPGTNCVRSLVHLSYVPRIVVVINYLIAICH